MRLILTVCCSRVLAVLLLSGCAPVLISQETRLVYKDARDALEAGDYSAAVRRYEEILSEAGHGPIGISVGLEYAHALLRAHKPERALAVAREIEIRGTDPATVGRARLVAAVAAHELAERAVAQGAPYEEARARARAAFRRLGDASSSHPQFDPEGILVPRMRSLRELLAELEIEQLRADLKTGDAGDRAVYILREFGDTAAVADARSLILRARHVE